MREVIKIKSVESGNPFKSVIQTSYDIITKGREGNIKVESEEGVGAEFVVKLSLE